MNGFWVVLEDIDKAPSDVPLVLSPLLGGSCSFVTSQGEVYTLFLLLCYLSYTEKYLLNNSVLGTCIVSFRDLFKFLRFLTFTLLAGDTDSGDFPTVFNYIDTRMQCVTHQGRYVLRTLIRLNGIVVV